MQKDSIWLAGVAGMMSGMASSTILTPIELIKCRLQVS